MNVTFPFFTSTTNYYCYCCTINIYVLTLSGSDPFFSNPLRLSVLFCKLKKKKGKYNIVL